MLLTLWSACSNRSMSVGCCVDDTSVAASDSGTPSSFFFLGRRRLFGCTHKQSHTGKHTVSTATTSSTLLRWSIRTGATVSWILPFKPLFPTEKS